MRIRRAGVTCWLVILAQLSPWHSFDDDQRGVDRVPTLSVDPLVPGTVMRREVPDALARLWIDAKLLASPLSLTNHRVVNLSANSSLKRRTFDLP